MSRRSSLAAALLAVTATSACAPIVSHGSHIRPGFSGGSTTVIGSGPTYENGDDPGPLYLGAATLNAAYGWVPSNAQVPSVRVGLQAPVAADLYVQAPRGWLGPGAVGVGMLYSLFHTMPYLQTGVQKASGLGLHALAGRYAYRGETSVLAESEERARVYLGAAQVPMTGRMTVHVHAGYADGHVRRRLRNSSTFYIDEDRWARLAGFTVEFHAPRPE